jgi:hypothetical protein
MRYQLVLLITFSVIVLETNGLFLYKSRSAQVETNSVGVGNRLETIAVLTRFIRTYKPELLPVLTEIAIANPAILRLITGGINKRDTESQLRPDTQSQLSPDTEDPTVTRRMFHFVLDNDSDDCFKKFTCSLSKKNNFNSSQLMDLELDNENNESISRDSECSQKYSKCSFKEYKIRDMIDSMSEPLRGIEKTTD